MTKQLTPDNAHEGRLVRRQLEGQETYGVIEHTCPRWVKVRWEHGGQDILYWHPKAVCCATVLELIE